MKRAGILSLVLCLLLAGCAQKRTEKYTATWLDLFDTQIRLTAFAGSRAEFDRAAGGGVRAACAPGRGVRRV